MTVDLDKLEAIARAATPPEVVLELISRARQSGDRSIEVALTSSAQFLESLLAENVPGQRIRLEAALEGVQRVIAALAPEPAPC